MSKGKVEVKFRKGQNMRWVENEAFSKEMSKNNQAVCEEKEQVKHQNQDQRGEFSGRS